jgi:type II secretory pathway component PulC
MDSLKTELTQISTALANLNVFLSGLSIGLRDEKLNQLLESNFKLVDQLLKSVSAGVSQTGADIARLKTQNGELAKVYAEQTAAIKALETKLKTALENTPVDEGKV